MGAMEKAMELKDAANADFKAKKFAKATKQYTNALKQLANSSDTSTKTLQAILYSNRAQCHLKLKTPKFGAALKDCRAALEADPSYQKALFRKAKAHEGLGLQNTDMAQLEDAVKCVLQLMSMDKSNQSYKSYMSDLRRKVEVAQAQRMSIVPYVEKLKNKRFEEQDFKAMMGLFVSADLNQKRALEAGLPKALFEVIFPPQTAAGNQVQPASFHDGVYKAHAARALQHIISMANKEKLELDKPTYSVYEQYTAPLLLTLSLHQKDAADCDQNGTVMVVDKDTDHLYSSLVILASRIAASPQLSVHRDKIAGVLLNGIYFPPGMNDASLSLERTHKIVVALEGVAHIAESSDEALSAVREFVLPHLLFGAVSKSDKLHKPLLAALAILAQDPVRRRDMGKSKKNSIFNDEAPESEEYKKFKMKVAQWVLAPVIQAIPHLMGELPMAKGIAPQDCIRATKALSLLLQSAPALGIFLVNIDPGKKNPKGKTEAAMEAKAKEIKALNEATKSAAVSPEPTTIEEVKDGEVEEKKKTSDDPNEENETPSILEILLTMACSTDQVTKFIAAEVLALSSSDPIVRTTVAQSGQADIFQELLQHHSTQAVNGSENEKSSTSELVRTHAALALSKLQATGEIESTQTEQQEMLAKMMECVPKLGQKSASDGQKCEKEEEREMEIQRQAVETLAYASLDIKNKKDLATRDKGEWFQRIGQLANSEDNSIRFGVIQIITNMTTSTDDIEREFDAEVEQLKKVARKGLPGNQTEKEEERNKRAGSAGEIKVLRKLAAQRGAVRFLYTAAKQYWASAAEVEERQQEDKAKEERERRREETKKEKEKQKEEAQKSKENKDSQTESDTDKPAPRKKEPHHKKKEKPADQGGMSDNVADSMTTALVQMASEKENRGFMIQQGAMPLLLRLCKHRHQKSAERAALALARICITTDPNMFPNSSLAFSIVKPILSLMKKAEHELYQFEACMALTNLIGFNKEVSDLVVAENGWYELTMLLGTENHLLQRSVVEAMCNLCINDKILERLASEGGEQDLMFFLLFSQVEDVPTQMAATGSLAMVSQHPEVAKRIAHCKVNSSVKSSGLEDEDETGKVVVKDGERWLERTRDGYEIVQDLLEDMGTHPEVLRRLEVCFDNMEKFAPR
eukprot:gb/GEZN01000211.1/.p1 GENE.gb/GEZN01000211.1/~~gb/GEZN01000211.1/.p1  ORF type:complete len:1147 (-),score=257.96 gb/GEZN01000211.1/:2145-5585(-)